MLVSGSVDIVDSLMLQKSDEVFRMYQKTPGVNRGIH